MEKTSKKWQIAPVLTPEAEKSLNDFPQPLRQILFNRGYSTQTSALNFLTAAPPPNSESKNLLGMGEAVSRLTAAIANGEAIAIYGDYDADGVTATALMVQVLSALFQKAYKIGIELRKIPLLKIRPGPDFLPFAR